MRQDFHIILIPLLPVPELACPLEKEPEEETPAQKNFNMRAPNMTDYTKKRSSKKPATRETSSDHPLDMKVLQALNQVVQEPQVVVENLMDIIADKPGKGKPTPINIQPTGTGNICLTCLGTRKSRLKPYESKLLVSRFRP